MHQASLKRDTLKLKNKETVVEGIEQAVSAFIGLFKGKKRWQDGGEVELSLLSSVSEVSMG